MLGGCRAQHRWSALRSIGAPSYRAKVFGLESQNLERIYKLIARDVGARDCEQSPAQCCEQNLGTQFARGYHRVRLMVVTGQL